MSGAERVRAVRLVSLAMRFHFGHCILLSDLASSFRVPNP